MIILDTNVLSVLMESYVDSEVVDWLNNQPAESIWTTTITVFEVRLGLDLLPRGRRRNRIEAAFERVLSDDVQRRVLTFDYAAAHAAGAFAAQRRRSGRPVEIRDMQIAGIASIRRATLATRNVRDFEGLGLNIVNPWSP